MMIELPDPNPWRCPKCRQWVEDVPQSDFAEGPLCLSCWEDKHGPQPEEPPTEAEQPF